MDNNQTEQEETPMYLCDFGYSRMSMSDHKTRVVKMILDENIVVKEL